MFRSFLSVHDQPEVCSMNTKLTLTIEESVIKKAKKYASGKKRSLSDIVENYLKVIANEVEDKQNNELTPLVKSLKGSFKAPEDFDYTKELSKSLSGKYVVNEKDPD